MEKFFHVIFHQAVAGHSFSVSTGCIWFPSVFFSLYNFFQSRKMKIFRFTVGPLLGLSYTWSIMIFKYGEWKAKCIFYLLTHSHLGVYRIIYLFNDCVVWSFSSERTSTCQPPTLSASHTPVASTTRPWCQLWLTRAFLWQSRRMTSPGSCPRPKTIHVLWLV